MTLPIASGLAGKAAIVTGGSRGIGRATVALLAAEGVDVTFFYRDNAQAAQAVVAAGHAAGHAIEAVAVDIRDAPACAPRWNASDRTGRIDVLVNNAGVIRDSPLTGFSDADVDDVIGTNVTGVFNVTRAVAPYMISRRSGKIINVSSVSGEKGGRGQTNYAASKGAINAFTRALAVELAPRRSMSTRWRRASSIRKCRMRCARWPATKSRRAFCSSATARWTRWRTPSGSWPPITRITSPARC
jgi:3-oxoacyl-[acyl-carrier protein] reductase